MKIIRVIKKGWLEVNRIRRTWRELDRKMPRVTEKFHKVRTEISDLGLLSEGVYLDKIDLLVSMIPSYGVYGYTIEGSSKLSEMLGFYEGTIYLPSDLPEDSRVPGGTMLDTIRHEFAHAWYWLDPDFINDDWFLDAFGAEYTAAGKGHYVSWKNAILHNKNVPWYKQPRNKAIYQDYVSLYAATKPSEDFAETFMMYLRYRKSLGRFRKREGVWKKISSIDQAIQRKRLELNL